jgi:hypothetical protein
MKESIPTYFNKPYIQVINQDSSIQEEYDPMDDF